MPFTILSLVSLLAIEVGAAADWVMVIVTAITAYFLFKTLQMQGKTSKEQSKLFEIEQRRYLKQIRPRPELKLKMTSPWDSKLEFYMHDNPAYNLTVTITKMISVKMPNNPDNLPLPFKVLNIDQSWQLRFELDPPNASEELMESVEIEVKCIFENEIGVKYEQEFHSLGLTDFTSTPPKFIES